MTDIEISELLPQQHPFIMVDRLLYYDPVFTRTILEVRRDNILNENGFLSEAGLIENMAQTCAARMGYINKILQNGKIKTGYIGAIKDLQIYQLPVIGACISTEIEVLTEVLSLTLVKASVKQDDLLLCQCEMKIALIDTKDEE